MNQTLQYIKTNWKAAVALAFGLAFAYLLSAYLVIEREASKVYTIDEASLRVEADTVTVGIVFGGGISDRGPLPLLQDRLDAGKNLLDEKLVEKLILSGDNRTLDYNEPAAMLAYLEQQGVPTEKLQLDFAGRSTFETCERANRVFQVERAILISESTHLARAIYLCEHFGIESFGLQSDGQASSGLKIGQRWREVLARSKAVFNAYIIGEETILGDPIDL